MAHARHHRMHAGALALTFGLLAAGVSQCSPRPAHAQENSKPGPACAPIEAVTKNAASLGFVAAAKWTGQAGETLFLFINPQTRALEIMISPPGNPGLLCDGPVGKDFRPAQDAPAPPVRHGHPSGRWNI